MRNWDPKRVKLDAAGHTHAVLTVYPGNSHKRVYGLEPQVHWEYGTFVGLREAQSNASLVTQRIRSYNGRGRPRVLTIEQLERALRQLAATRDSIRKRNSGRATRHRNEAWKRREQRMNTYIKYHPKEE